MEGVCSEQFKPDRQVKRMKINEVEQIAGISKKNIRFYEEEGLLKPGRNAKNGYREYTEADVLLLQKIKLLRKLSVPIEEIRRILEGKLTLSDCMERHRIFLEHEMKNLEVVQQMSSDISHESVSLNDMDPCVYLERMDELEKGGSRFMNVSKTDVIKRKRSAAAAACAAILLAVLWDVLILSANAADPAPAVMVVLLAGLPLVVVAGVLIALRERMKEIEGGEIDEASNY